MTHTLQLPKNLLMSSRRCPPWAPCLNSRRSQFPRPPCGAQNTAKHYISHAKACERGKEPFHREKRTCVCVCVSISVCAEIGEHTLHILTPSRRLQWSFKVLLSFASSAVSKAPFRVQSAWRRYGARVVSVRYGDL